jgi:hypothetical protein
MSNFLDNFFGVLFSPDETFDNLRENPPLSKGFYIVIFISLLQPLLDLELTGGKLSLLWFGLKVFGSIFFGILSWLFFAFFIDAVANIFCQSGKIKTFLTLFAFALVPWMFMAPIELLKTGGVIEGIMGVFLGFFVWLWVIILTIKAIIKSYQLSFGRTLVLITIPFMGSFLALYWISIFFSTLFHILNG